MIELRLPFLELMPASETFMTDAALIDAPCEPAVKPLPRRVTRAARPPRRVLHLVNGEHYAGAERVQDLLGRCLPQFDFEIGYACLKPDRFAALRQSQDVPLYELPMRSKFDIRPAWQIARILRQEKYSLIHTHTPRAAFIGQIASTLTGLPMVHHVHSPTNHDTTHPWRNRINWATERISLCRVSAVIAVSRTLGHWTHELGLPRWMVSVVHNGVPAHAELADRAAPRGQWILGTIALFRPRKGLEVLLEALAQLRAAGQPVRLRAVGCFETMSYEREIKQLAARLQLGDAVDWVGFRQDIPAELARMDLFVLPSLFGEGLPMVLLEAMAEGVPVIATRVEGAPEAVRHELEGLLVEPGDPLGLSQEIRRLIEGQIDWHELREAAHRRQRKCFSDASMAEGVAHVYQKVLDA
jgi:glycosyltransferase involved in cell wall biosynthesis